MIESKVAVFMSIFCVAYVMMGFGVRNLLCHSFDLFPKHYHDDTMSIVRSPIGVLIFPLVLIGFAFIDLPRRKNIE